MAYKKRKAVQKAVEGAFSLARNAYGTVEEWASDRGRQIRDFFQITVGTLAPFGPVSPKTLSADEWNRQKLASLHPAFRPRFEAFLRDAQAIARANGRELLAWQTTRPVEKQLEYVRRGNSKTIASRHLFGLAVDLALRDAVTGGYDGPCEDCKTKKWPDWYKRDVVAAAKRQRFVWGGDWKGFEDTPHFEVPEAEWPQNVKVAAAALRADFPGVA